MKKQSKYKYIVVLQGMFDGQWIDLVTYDKQDVQERKNDIRSYRESNPRPYRFVNRRELNPDYVKPEPTDKERLLLKLKDLCYRHFETVTDDMEQKLDNLLKTYGPALAENADDNAVNLVALSVITALLRHAEFDCVGNLNDKTVSKEARKQNLAMKRLIEKIYATL